MMQSKSGAISTDVIKTIERMKSIKEKAKAYDEAYKKVAVRFGSNVADEIFPELKESEDEKMMNQLHSWMKEFGGAEEYTEKVYQWIKGLLEKQGEHANFLNKIQVGDKVTRNEDGVLVNLSQLNRVAKKQGKNNMGISEATKQKLEDNLNKALEKETPESWNEFLEKQDEYKPNPCDECININGCINCENGELKETEQKPAWSEEDEAGLGDALWAIQQARAIAKDENDMGNLWYAENWLKSLKDRYTWKPTEEQMGVIEAVRNNRSFQRRHLDSLYEQLKKLREEAI